MAVVNGPGSDREKREKLTQIIDSAVDVDAVARFCLGRFWRKASPDQQKRYTELFHHVLVNNITSKLGEYRASASPWAAHSSAMKHEWCPLSSSARTIRRPMSTGSSATRRATPKVIDVVAEGTSLRLTQRQDYASYLSRNNNNIDALINAMRQQVAQAG